MNKPMMYVVRKYVKASSVAEAIRLEKSIKPHEVFVDESWQKTMLADAIGFKNTHDQS